MQEFMQLNRNLKLRTLTVFLAALLNSSIFPNMTIYYSHYFGRFITGILLMLISGVSFVAGMYGGHLADVYGRKPIMLTGGLLLTTGYVIAAAANNPLLVSPQITFFAFLIASVGGSLADPAEQAMMIDASTAANRKFVYALIYWIINISVMLGAALGGWFFRDYLLELLLALIAVSLFNLAIVRFGMSETMTEATQTSSSVWGALKSYLNVLADRRYMLFIIGSVLLAIVTRQPDYYLAVHLGADFHTTTLFGITIYGQRMLSIVTLVNTVMIVTMMSLFTRLTDKWSLVKANAVGAVLFAVGFAFSFVTSTLWPLIAAAVILTLGEMISVPANQTLRADMMNPAKIGAYSGLMSVVSPIAAIFAGLLVSASSIFGNYGMAVLMLIFGGLSILATTKAARMRANW
ncbi:MFS transporter [Lacticaseibacillus sharpeae]|uniref:Major facilitator family transporter n=1 Tax=Lacticaseibacillus sharpeae JCM 1186 = DSM 20505 TaxID=1291052 RepID=A0A0R1ZWH9_9LACO|nr:MFS transporter [Lacticaseibacillus sharpeae]KRM56150.1 major facilitator family transporter [Lacticaseibacillus sharpeae JCM 1186 = DSM 20505]